MEYRKLGNTGLKVSSISLGSWLNFSNPRQKNNSYALIDRAYELGINFFDSANVYDDGQAELFLGKALKKYPRQSFVVTTKAFWPIGDGPNDHGLSRKHLIEQVNKSLKKLQMDYIDIFYCHRFDNDTPLEETLKTLDDMVRQGKILYLGVSEWTVAQMEQALRVADAYLLDRIVVNQPSYNILDRYIEDDIIPFAQSHGIAQVVFSPLAQGILTGKYKNGERPPSSSRGAKTQAAVPTHKWKREDILEGKYKRGQLWTGGDRPAIPPYNKPLHTLLNENVLCKVSSLGKIAQELGITLSQLSLSWVLRQPMVASAVIGASSPWQIEENVQAVSIKLSEDVLLMIDNALEMIV